MTTAHSITPSQLIDSAHQLADASGKAILKYFRKPIAVENKAGKGAYDPVTEADRAGERAIRKLLQRLHPDHGVHGEELGQQAGAAPYSWVIDPIDGTRAFITGMPLWGTLIGVTHDGRAVAGMMDQPYTRERVWGDGKRAMWRATDGRARRVRTVACSRIEDARLTSTSPDLFHVEAERDAFLRLKAKARLTRFGGDCYAYALLAAGHIDLVVEAGLQAYDIVALVPIIESAGGVVTTWDGQRPEAGGRIVAAGDPRLHELALKALRLGGR